jgi:hypothetical protein
LLEDEAATPRAIEAALRGLAAMKPDDVAVVFLAGHGAKRPGSDDMVFVTSDTRAASPASGLDWTILGGALMGARGRVVVLLDACHAGHISYDLVVPNSELADNLVRAQHASVLVFAGSQGDQESLELHVDPDGLDTPTARKLVLDDERLVVPRPKSVHRMPSKPMPVPAMTLSPGATARQPRDGQGYFAGAVIAALESASTDANRNGLIELSELVIQVAQRVGRASHNAQTPWVARRELFGDYAIATAAK